MNIKDLTINNLFNKSLLKFTLILLFIISAIYNFTGCFGCYSFTGASIPPHLQTLAIPIAEDRSGQGEPGMRELFTEKLTQKFINDNSLQIADKNVADAILECAIISISDAPAVITQGESVPLRRITVGIRVVYKDLVKRITIFEKSFSNYSDYSPSGGSLERSLSIENAIDKITEDILLDTVSGW